MYHLDRLLIDAEVLIEHFSQLDRPHSPFFFTPSSPSLETENVLFNTFALGGTFNHLHSGHKILPTMVAWLTTHRLIVWITGQSPKTPPANGWIPSRAPATWLRSIQRTLGRPGHCLDASESVQGMLGRRDHPEDGVQPGVHRTLDWECPMDNKKTINRTLLRRQEAVRGFVGRVGPSDLRTETLVLQDVYGPTATDPTTDGLFVSLETLPGAKTINTICTQKGLKPLMTYVIDLISNQLTLTQLNQLNLKISSTQICAWLNPH
ncbi:hypothetical protein PGT21_025955 [Puccinia graminis f. sp. tritici]|uniref:Cytidyltransferase-like domain-containing protein n=1 Tax=Puccinia graminis f. sp. tritici TaxID=56615 RepID=A0A5B0N9I2_PUCGR|nr:hypothetical protein PGT21_025955 [Puccinia graminis f. sp. tritici]